jgi:hypothetical protein
MATYIISYDLIKTKDYPTLYEAIKSLGRWAKITESTWAITSDKTCSEVRDFILQYMDNDDRLFVVQSSGVGAWRNTKCSNEWLKNNL